MNLLTKRDWLSLCRIISKCSRYQREYSVLPKGNIVLDLLGRRCALVQINPPDMLFDNVNEAQCIAGFFVKRPLGKPASDVEKWLEGSLLVMNI